jgi:hypothetical protein
MTRRSSATLVQTNFPRLEADGVTHRRECECPRCDAGYRPSESERALAARRWRHESDREKAQSAHEKLQEKKRVRALKLGLALAAEAKETEARLLEQDRLAAGLADDPRLAELLRLRRAGVPVAEALDLVERRPAWPAGGRRGSGIQLRFTDLDDGDRRPARAASRPDRGARRD